MSTHYTCDNGYLLTIYTVSDFDTLVSDFKRMIKFAEDKDISNVEWTAVTYQDVAAEIDHIGLKSKNDGVSFNDVGSFADAFTYKGKTNCNAQIYVDAFKRALSY
jgi:hypothetical protein